MSVIQIDAIEAWKCPGCSTWYPSYEEAEQCCPVESCETMYPCPECGLIYDEGFEAAECCDNYHECEVCGTDWTDEADAEECCEDG